jgi:HPr Serine kinase C-terminal domain
MPLDLLNTLPERGEPVLDDIAANDRPRSAGMAAIDVVDDPLHLGVAMPFVAVQYPLGFGLEITTNSEEVLAAAAESWSLFSPRQSGTCFQLRVGVMEGSSKSCPPAPVCRGHRNLLSMVADTENFAICDLSRGFAFAWFSQGAVRHRSYLRYHFLEACALALLAASRVTPIHAGCIERRGCGVLLCGDSGAGKSSLAFGCARDGWTYIADDSCYLINGGKNRLVAGNPHNIRFRPSAVELFPELAGLSITPRAAGKPSIELPTTKLPYLQTAGECQVDQIIFLNRNAHTPPALVPHPRDLAMRWFSRAISNSGGSPDVQTASIGELLTLPIHELRYRDLDWAVRRLNTLALEGK